MRENWIIVDLGEVLKTTSGGTPNRSNKSYYNGSISWVKSGELNQNTIFETEEHISAEAVKNSSAKIFPKGTLLIALYGATIGKLAFLGIDAATNQAVCGIFENQAVVSKFLYYYLFHNRRKLIEQGTGGAQPNISQTILKKLPIVIAPLPEQRAIVARIEELFSELDHSIANLKSAQAKLGIYRQAVLKKAFEGGFTREFRLQHSISGDWKFYKLQDIVEKLTQGWSPKCINQASSDPNEWAVIKTSSIQHGKFVEEENKILPTNLEPRIQHEIKVGDILITRAGPRNRVGVCCEVKKTRPRLLNCDKVYLIRLKESVNLSFFMLKINSAEFINKIEEIKTGGNDSGVNLTQNRLLDLNIELPESIEQIQIVQEIESRLSVADKLAETIQTNLLKSESLRQSILKQAFEGKLLTEAELEACRKEVDWEPAEKLLERIKQEKNKSKKL